MLIVLPLMAVGLAWAAIDWRTRFPWLMGASLALPGTAALSAGGQDLSAYPLFALLAVPTGVVVWFRRGAAAPWSWSGALPLLIFVGWGLFITVAGPTIFDGYEVLAANGGIDEEVADPSALTYTISNVAQWGYVAVGLVLFCYFATIARVSRHVLAPGLGMAMLLSNWRLLHDKVGVWFPISQVDNAPSLRYVDFTATGEYRLRGVFPEPSALAHYSLAAAAMSLALLPRATPVQRVMYVLIAASAAINLGFASSGTGTVGGALITAMALGIAFVRTVRHGASPLPLLYIACDAGVIALAFRDSIFPPLVEQVSEKLLATSYLVRSTADVFSLKLGIDSYGLGVGLGSNRPSSLWPMLVSCVGVIGVVSFVTYLVILLRRASEHVDTRVYFWVLLVATTTKSVAGSNLSDPLFQLSIALAAAAAGRRVLSHRPSGAHARSEGEPLSRPSVTASTVRAGRHAVDHSDSVVRRS